MKTPGYWKNKGFYARLLLPVGMLYSAATAFRFKLKQPRKVPVPVICIGNLTAGGPGKTLISNHTGDTGIVLYGLLSLSAIAGTAVLLRKRRTTP